MKKTISEKKETPRLFDYNENCCGCAACCAICPVGAINMKEDREGFAYPIVDSLKCIKCYQCVNVCAFKLG